MTSDRLIRIAIGVVIGMVLVWFLFGTTATPPMRPPGPAPAQVP